MSVGCVQTFNRTIEELKCLFLVRQQLRPESFNRTIEELKYSLPLLCVKAKISFNRTIEELKYKTENSVSVGTDLLIAP